MQFEMANQLYSKSSYVTSMDYPIDADGLLFKQKFDPLFSV